MKIDIITLHRVRNYGSSLQALATQLFLEQMGCETEIIDYYPRRYTSTGLLMRLKNKDKRLASNSILLIMAQIAIYPSYLKKIIIFDGFLRKYLKVTNVTYRSEKELFEDPPIADAYCTGSDQVWNSLWNEGIDWPFYLRFLPDAAFRFSYASSFGSHYVTEDELEKITPHLKKYRFISVRENSGVDILSHAGIKGVRQMPDPTLLLDKEQWSAFSSRRHCNYKYMVTYNLHHDPRIDSYANEVARRNHLVLYHISYNWHDVVRKGRLIWCPKVEKYLGLLRDAEYIITDSFHATVFSLIFERKFTVLFPEEASSRLRSILALTGLEDHGFDEMPPAEAADYPMNFDGIRHILEAERAKAKAYIECVLKDMEYKKESKA